MTSTDSDETRLMQILGKVEFPEFLADADAALCRPFNEWRVRFIKYAPFHFFSRNIPEENRKEAIKAAFDNMRLIASHKGKINICGVFIREVEEITVFDNERDRASIRLAYSEILEHWFYGIDYKLYNSGGGGFAPSITACGSSQSEKTRDGAEIVTKK
jgi:hypothetical protein